MCHKWSPSRSFMCQDLINLSSIIWNHISFKKPLIVDYQKHLIEKIHPKGAMHPKVHSITDYMEVTWVSINRGMEKDVVCICVCIYIYICICGGCSVAQSCLILCDPMDCSIPGIPGHHHLPKLAQTHVRWVGDAIRPSHPLSSPSPPALNLSQHQGRFQWVHSSHQVAKYWSISLSISPSNEYLGMTPFTIAWFDLLVVQETLKSLLQRHN